MRFPGSKYEDGLLRALWEQRRREGWWLKEVGLRYPPAEPSPRDRFLDALIVLDAAPKVSDKRQDIPEMEEAIRDGAQLEFVEAKKYLNTNVIGQLICGLSMFKAMYPGHGPLKLVAVVGHDKDAAMHWYCEREGIEVIRVDPLWEES